ncbi:MAG: NAD-dependent epimerase/dehydratase family protein [Chloroflexota bacterium]
MRVLVTGGTGFIGRSLVRGALGRGWEVVVLARRPEALAARSLAALGARLVMGDLTDRGSSRAAFEVAAPDLVFHLAGWYELGIARKDRRRMWALNVEATELALNLAAEVGAAKVVFTSSTTALGDTGGETVDESFVRCSPPLSYYEATKSEAHRHALRHQQAGEPVVIACPAQVIGPGDHSVFGHLARLYMRRRLPPLTWAPEGAFTFAHVEDVAEGLLLAGEKGKPGELYFLAGMVLTIRQMLDVWRQGAGLRTPFIWLPRWLALAQAALLTPARRALRLPEFMSPEAVRSSFVSFRYSSQKAVRELGARFRTAEQAWEDTLKVEREGIGGRLSSE